MRLIRKKGLFLGLCLALIVGCATSNRQQTRDQRGQNFNIQMDQGINRMTFDQAIMTWGQPVSVTQGYEILVATWTQESSSDVTIPWMGPGPSPHLGFSVTSRVSHGWSLQLTFDKQTRLLKHWQLREW